MTKSTAQELINGEKKTKTKFFVGSFENCAQFPICRVSVTESGVSDPSCTAKGIVVA